MSADDLETVDASECWWGSENVPDAAELLGVFGGRDVVARQVTLPIECYDAMTEDGSEEYYIELENVGEHTIVGEIEIGIVSRHGTVTDPLSDSVEFEADKSES